MPLSTIRFDIVCRIVSALLAHDVPEGLRQLKETPSPQGGVSHVDRVAAELLSVIKNTWTQSRRFRKYVHHELRSHVLWHDLNFWSSTFVHMVQDELRSLFAPLFECKAHEVGRERGKEKRRGGWVQDARGLLQGVLVVIVSIRTDATTSIPLQVDLAQRLPVLDPTTQSSLDKKEEALVFQQLG